MDQLKMRKIKPCIVKLNRFNLMDDPEIIRDRILEKRIQKCHVLVRRFDLSKLIDSTTNGVHGQFKVRHCRVRLPKLNLEVFDSLENSSSELDIVSETGCTSI